MNLLRPRKPTARVIQDGDYTVEHIDGSPFGITMKTLDGVDWMNAPLPPTRHTCWPQLIGETGIDTVHRCACGAIKNAREGWGWHERNSRRSSR